MREPILFDVAVHPVTGDVWVANSDSRDLTRFEPELRGHVVDHRLTKLDAVTALPTVFDLNPGIDIHTANNGGGEMRGFLVAVPEPATSVLGLLALGPVILRRRRR